MPGPRPTARCQICGAPRAADIDAMVRSGAKATAVARAFGLSGPELQALRRHIHGAHVAPAPPAPGVAPSSPPGDPDADHATILKEALNALRALDPTKMAPAAQVARIDAIRRASESLGKVAPLPPLPDQPLEGREDFRDLMRTIFEVIEVYPAIREQIADAFAAAKGTPAHGVLDRSVLNTVDALSKIEGINPTLATSLETFANNFYLAHSRDLMGAH